MSSKPMNLKPIGSKHSQILEKRARLLTQCESQRTLIGECTTSWRKPLQLADQGIEVLRYLKQHPAWLVGTGVMLIALKPARTLRWVKLTWAAWLIMRKLRK